MSEWKFMRKTVDKGVFLFKKIQPMLRLSLNSAQALDESLDLWSPKYFTQSFLQ